ncbi:MAG: hypothetical protein M0D53_15215 [Flavobacterium sp. JAD_PAG50586_2]|jgi:hypothetical protein|nr:MAG: hypothetical protein M0D53_15215 [Flavobacterium sp. JAD_PAG50586_2]
MNLAILIFIMVLAVILIVLIIKENLDFQKEINTPNRPYDSRLKNELEASEE